MDKEQLEKILEPVKKMCSSCGACSNCPVVGKDHRCSMGWKLVFGVNHGLVDNIGELYIEMLNKCIHEFCGKDSCKDCHGKCTFRKLPALWDFDELP